MISLHTRLTDSVSLRCSPKFTFLTISTWYCCCQFGAQTLRTTILLQWRRKWQPTPVFLPGESHGRRSLAGYSSRGRKESDTTERLHLLTYLSYYKGQYSQSYGFPSSHVRLWERDNKKGWVLKNWSLWTMVLQKTLESPLDKKKIKTVHPKGNQPWIFTGRTDAKAKAPTLWPPDAKNWLLGKHPDAGKDWRQEEKGITEDKMVGWHHWLDGHDSEQTLGDGERQGARCAAVHGVTKSWTWMSK